MASFISALSLLILVLVNGYFAVPIVDKSSNESFPSLLNDLTTVQVAQLQFVSDNETVESLLKHKQPIGESVGFRVTTSSDNLSAENIARASRMFDTSFSSELLTSTTEGSSTPQIELKNLSSIQRVDRRQRDIKSENEDESEPEPEIETDTEKEEENKDSSETKVDKRGIPIESTTTFTTSFTSTTPLTLPTIKIEPSTITIPSITTTITESSTTTTTSTLLPQFTTLETTTKKYTGLLTDDKEPQEEIEQQPFKKPIKNQPTKTKFQPDDTSDELVKTKPKQNPTTISSEDDSDVSAPVALYQKDEINRLSTVPSGIMVLDEHNDVVIPGVLNKFSTSNKENKEERKQLNQGEKSSHSEEEKSNN